MRLIDADALKEKLQAHHDFFVNAWGGFSNLPQNDKARVDEITSCIVDVVNAPTVDAVEVVRCKDCKYQCTESCPTYYEDRMTYRDSWSLDGDNDFCSYGERRTDNA